MEKTLYNVVLRDECDQHHFLNEGDAKGLEVASQLSEIKGLVTLRLTHQEAMDLLESDDVVTLQAELPVVSSLYPTSTRTITQDLITYTNPAINTHGYDYTSTMFHFMSDIPIAGNTAPIGGFASEDKRSDNEVISQNFAGQYVDIVAIEAGTPSAGYDYYEEHYDFLEEGVDADPSTTTRFVKMDWNVYDAGITSARNRQVTNNTAYWDAHAIGVLSAAAGKYCGWAKASSIRVIYLSDGVATAYNAVLAWHNAKPVNPVTGKRNATITTGAWGYLGDITGGFLIETIRAIEAYDASGNLTTINRPGGGWGSDLSPFYNNGIVPRVIQDPADSTDKWVILRPVTGRATFLDTIMDTYASTAGIYHFKSAGNNARVCVKPNDPRWNTRILTNNNSTGGSYNWISITSSGGTYSFTTTGPALDLSFYPLRSYGDGLVNAINVGAAQHSTANPLADSYSNRGPMIDIFGFGAYTWTCYPLANYTGPGGPALPWGYFSGTSCAAPTVAGMAALMVDHFFVQRGVYPTFAQLKNLITSNAKSVMQSDTSVVNFSSVPSAGGFFSTKLYAGSSSIFRITSGANDNGGLNLCELHGATTLRAFIPYKIRLGNGQYISDVRGPAYGSRPTSGQAYPRRKIKIA